MLAAVVSTQPVPVFSPIRNLPDSNAQSCLWRFDRSDLHHSIRSSKASNAAPAGRPIFNCLPSADGAIARFSQQRTRGCKLQTAEKRVRLPFSLAPRAQVLTHMGQDRRHCGWQGASRLNRDRPRSRLARRRPTGLETGKLHVAPIEPGQGAQRKVVSATISNRNGSGRQALPHTNIEIHVPRKGNLLVISWTSFAPVQPHLCLTGDPAPLSTAAGVT
jgi:hypothetical protein